MKYTLEQIQWFFARIEQVGDCWIWKGSKNTKGYGRMRIGQRQMMAHRISYEMWNGGIPDGLQIDHSCRQTSCVNPAHLEPVTCRENLMRGNTIAARNAAKTHCVRGHEFTLENTGTTRRGQRWCKACIRSRTQAV